MKIFKNKNFYLLCVLILTISSCMQQDSSETVTSNPNDGVEQDTILEVSLGGASRAERFMGSFDEIDRLALDVIRNYGNKEVVHDLKMDNSTGVWKATVPNLIVGFEYTVKGHAYRPHNPSEDDWIAPFAPNDDLGGSWVEIFRGMPLTVRRNEFINMRLPNSGQSFDEVLITRFNVPINSKSKRLGY